MNSSRMGVTRMGVRLPKALNFLYIIRELSIDGRKKRITMIQIVVDGGYFEAPNREIELRGLIFSTLSVV